MNLVIGPDTFLESYFSPAPDRNNKNPESSIPFFIFHTFKLKSHNSLALTPRGNDHTSLIDSQTKTISLTLFCFLRPKSFLQRL